MKRLLPLLLALLLVLSGCGGAANSTPDEDQPPSAVEPDSPDQTQTPAPPDLETVAIAGAAGLYDVSALPQLSELHICAMALEDEEHLILVAGRRCEEVYRFSLETGELSLICTLPITETVDWPSASIDSVDPLVVCEYDDYKYYYIDGEGNSHVLPQSDYDGYWNAIFTPQDCVWYQSTSGILWRQPLDGGEAEEIARLPQDYYYISLAGATTDGTDAVFTATGTKNADILLLLSLETGEITGMYESPKGDYGYPTADPLVKQVSISCVQDEQTPSLFHVTARDAQGHVAADFDLTPPGDSGDEVWLSEYGSSQFWGKTLLTLWSGEEQRFLLWDYRELTPEPVEPVTLTEYVPPVPATPESLTQRAEALEETYGIQIHIGQDMDAPYPDYTLSACEDTEAIDDMMDVMEQALSLYPEDYFQQLGGDNIRGFSFYFSGQMTPIDPSVSISNPAGLTCQVDGVELIAFDITGYIAVQDVVHELTHVLDHWLWEDVVLDEEVWGSMNPEDFDYYYAYIDGNGDSYELTGSDEYTARGDAYYEGDMDSVYFIDPYSTTYPTEDRARLMEYLLADVNAAPPDYFASVHLQEKLGYYFQCIRTKFDTTNWPEQTSWELRLAEAAPKGS